MQVTNKGRGEAVVQSWGFDVEGPDGKAGVVLGPLQQSHFGPDLPCIVKGLSSEMWNVDQGALEEMASNGGFARLRPFVTLGDGTRVEGEGQRVVP